MMFFCKNNFLYSFQLKRIYLSSLIVLVLVTSAACGAPGVRSEVSQNQKDPLFTYDGTYTASVKSLGGRQDLGHPWSINCGSQNFNLKFSIKDSEVTVKFFEKTVGKSYVDRDGEFRVESPLETKLRVTNGVATDDRRSIVLQGIIRRNVMEGRLLYALSQFNGRGCTYSVTYTADA